MTTLGFDEHDESYIEDAYDDFLPPAIYRCIKAEAKWDPQIDLTPSLEILTAFEQQIETICSQTRDAHDLSLIHI